MESVVQLLSPSAMLQAWTNVSALSPDDPVPLSAKREFYGLPAAFSQQDMIEELALVDYTDSARTLIALHPDMLCANPPGAAYIAAQYVAVNSNTTFLAGILRESWPRHSSAVRSGAERSGLGHLTPSQTEGWHPVQDGERAESILPRLELQGRLHCRRFVNDAGSQS